MLFNSFHFIWLFLPVTLLTWILCRHLFGIRVALTWLVLASLTFYALWNVHFLAVLLGSISINFWLSGKILHAKNQQQAQLATLWLRLGLFFNLALLGGFKYAYFFVSNVFALVGQEPPFPPLILPLAISFVTFQKIAYLVDCRQGSVTRHDALDYLFFVSFFPQLIAGPIVHHKPLIAQTLPDDNPLFKQAETWVAGSAFFAIGLFKKVVLADSLARYASPVFDLARSTVPGTESAWQGMLAYTLQLYFDFSGYSDMAIGLALLFGFKLPINFLSPYKARSIIEFWRRWHISLSAFLRDYLYIPLGGNRHGSIARYRNLWLTMLLAGLWHGAGWNFLLWGALHGTLLLMNHGWQHALAQQPRLQRLWGRLPSPLLVCMTFILVAFAWVLFRAADLSTAAHFYQALFNHTVSANLPALAWNNFGNMFQGMLATSAESGWLWVGAGLLIVMLAPNTADLLAYDAAPNTMVPRQWKFSLGVLVGVCFWFALKWMAVRPATEFLYFNF